MATPSVVQLVAEAWPKQAAALLGEAVALLRAAAFVAQGAHRERPVLPTAVAQDRTEKLCCSGVAAQPVAALLPVELVVWELQLLERAS